MARGGGGAMVRPQARGIDLYLKALEYACSLLSSDGDLTKRKKEGRKEGRKDK